MTEITAGVTIIIIGGGAAGIAAAGKLIGNGFQVVVLEAENRIGGRLNSGKTEEGWVELGAQWIHGENHWLYDFAKEHNLLGRSVEMQKESAILRQNGAKLTAQEHSNILTKINHICAQLTPEVLSKQPRSNSMGTCLRNAHEVVLSKTVEEKEMMEAELVYDWVNRYLKIDCGADSLHDVSIRTYIEAVCHGNYNHQLKISYAEFIQKHLLTEELSKRVRLNSTVKKITKKFTGVEVLLQSGERLQADHVIVTASLGVLQKNLDTLFEPSLPKTRQEAIRNMGYGLIGKIILFYDQPFWKSWKFEYIHGETRALSLFWDDNSSYIKSDPEKRYSNASWTRAIRSVLISESSPNVLIAFMAGALTLQMEKMDQEQIAKDMTDLLGSFSGLKDVPVPRKVIQSNWGSNENFCGTYSYISTQAGMANFGPKTLAEPLWNYQSVRSRGKEVPALLFAGEATHEQFFSMVHGAILSGWREADRLIDAYRQE